VLTAAAAVTTFLLSDFLLGSVTLFVAVVFLIGPHGAGILPEWSHIPFLVLCAGGVGYVSFKMALRVQAALSNRMGAD
jgi:hypothetical protein